MDDKQFLELFILRVEQMRAAQNEYFRTHSKASLRDSKGKEQAVDAICKMLRRKGYDPDQYLSREQPKLL